MTELWICTDCGGEVDFEERKAHMKDEHGVEHSIPEPICACSTHGSCERAKVLEGT